jgi:chaperonin cofactor prefoldin
MSKELDSVKQREMLQNNRNRDLQSQIQMQQDQIDELKRMIVDNLKSKIIS